MIQVKSCEPASKRARMDSGSQPETATGDDKCYVCDTTIVGKKYSLASCMTNGTKVRLVEVLGRLVCDNYMVVVSHGDYICRGCANLLNTLDRLDAEISSVKRIVLNFVERKYKLGDKVQSQLTPTPVVYSKTVPTTPTTNRNIKPYSPATTTFGKKVTVSPSVTKQASPAMKTKSFKINVQSEGVVTSAEHKVVNKTNPSPANTLPAQRNVWMQCNQCQYTTNQRAVMLEHLRQHVATKGPTTTTPTKISTPPNKVIESKTATTSAEVNGSPAALKPTKDKPSIMLTIDGKFAPLPTISKPTIIIKKSALISSISSPGIVTKMLSPTKNTNCSVVSEDKEITKTISIKEKPKEVTPQVFTSVKASGIPEPSMPSLLGEDDILSQTSPR